VSSGPHSTGDANQVAAVPVAGQRAARRSTVSKRVVAQRGLAQGRSSASAQRRRVPSPDSAAPSSDVSSLSLPVDVDASELDREVRKELLTLSKGLADLVGSHLVMTARLLDEDPQLALAHARFARSKAGRVSAVREAAGLAAYHAGEWSEALADLRAARRLGCDSGRLAVLADCERALGRPERALEISRSPEAGQLGTDEAVELRIVAAGARRDLGQFDAAVIALQGPDLDTPGEEPWRARLRYAYADNLLAAGREQDAITWFLAAADVDGAEATDAAERAVELSERPESE
jgi:tetratricopeptide (TPR) repeat protein